MTRFCRCRFFGGPLADRVMDWDEAEIRYPGVIQAPSRDRVEWSAPIGHVEEVTYSMHEYRWDETVNALGEYRMRWRPPAGYRPGADMECPHAERLLRMLGLGG